MRRRSEVIQRPVNEINGYAFKAGGSTPPPTTRETATATTSSLAPGGTWTGTITVPKTCALVRVETSRPAVVRAYGSAAARTADSTRPFTEPPGGGTGVQFQGTTVASLLEFVASATLSNDDDPAADLIYLHVENRDTSTWTITITFTVIPMED